MNVYLRAKFQVSSITLTSFIEGREGGKGEWADRVGVILNVPSKQTLEKPNQIRVKRMAGYYKRYILIELKF